MSRDKYVEKDYIVRLHDGRKLAYQEYGDSRGKPIFYFHGWPGSRLSGKETDEAARKLGVRVISPDRPGFGLSDFQEDRTLLGWPADVEELANKLGIKKFSVVGVSGGGPYAIVCAYKLPNRVVKAGVVVGLSPTKEKWVMKGMFPFYAWSWRHYHTWPFLTVAASWIAALEYKYIPLIGRIVGFQAKQDREILKHKSMESAKEAFRGGIKGSVVELKAFTDEWGFDLDKIKVPVYLWYGEKDKNVSVEMGKFYKSQISNSQLFIDKEGSHLSRYAYEDRILGKLM